MKLRRYFWAFFLSILAGAQGSFKVHHTKKAVIPFKLIGNLIFIPINVNGAELTFLLDTGLAETSVFSLQNGELKLASLEKIKFSGLGGNTSIDGFRSDHNTGKAGKNYVNDSMTLFIIVDQDFNISSHVGIPVNGIVGYHFFKYHPVVIDYISKKITVYNDDSLFRKKVKKYETFNISIEKNKPYLYADVEITDEKQDSKLLVDLGNSDAIWLFPAVISGFIYKQPYINDFLGRGFNGDVYGKRSRIRNFSLGPFTFKKPIAAMPDEYSVQHVNRAKDRKGSVGGEIMKRFTVAFDYAGQKIYLKKNRYFDDPFHFNMSGLDFRQDGMEWTKDLVNLPATTKESPNGGIEVMNNSLPYHFVLKPVFSIAGVRKDSPGARAGLLKDDRLISINGKKTADMSLQRITEIMKSAEGKTIEVLIERKNKRMTLSFTLEDPIPYQE